MLKGSTKRLRLEKGQEMDMRIMNINTKKEDDIKSDLKGIKLILNSIFANIKKYNNYINTSVYLENEKNEKANFMNEEIKKEGGINL